MERARLDADTAFTSPTGANRAFYAAFGAHDVEAMDRVWAEEHTVACTHPGKHAIVGRAAVMQSWREILEVPGATPTAVGPRLLRMSDDVVMVLCVERLGRVSYQATNVFVTEGGRWRMAHHHAGPLQPDLDD